MRKYIILCLINTCISQAWAQSPKVYWNFDEQQLSDLFLNHTLNISTYKPNINFVDGVKGRAIEQSETNSLVVSNLLRNLKDKKNLSLEFFSKGRLFMFTTFPSSEFRINFVPEALILDYTILRNGYVQKEQWRVPLTGSGVGSYNYLADGSWHHWVFTFSNDGQIRVWVDGQNPSSYRKKTNPFTSLRITSSDGFRMNAAIDELAFYTAVLDSHLIRQHNLEARKGKNYTFTIDKSIQQEVSKQTTYTAPAYDPREFAPGYPKYTVQALDQLQSFPVPRYAENHKSPRNFPWMDITYLHRELPGKGGKGFGKRDPSKAVAITQELAEKWNYYIELPCPRVDSLNAYKTYTSGVHRELVGYANSNPTIPVATVLFHVQNKPNHAGFKSSRPFVLDQNLGNEYYIKDASGKPVFYSGKKWLSPLAPLDFARNDALVSVFYLRQLQKHLTRPINIINENGEWFNHKRPESLLMTDPDVKAFAQRKNFNNDQLNGWMQNRFDSIHKSTILNALGWESTIFSFYNVSAYNSSYWPDYSMRINSNSNVKGEPRSTPSFYPSRPDNWRVSSGPLNGYGRVAEGRAKEIELGVKFFSPFVCAGWSFEEKNIRPAQWLGLLKSMVMLGADFFYTGYFNVTGGGKWPDGAGPFDPRGYVYQAAMPAYAQAMVSEVYDFIDKGTLLKDPQVKDPNMVFSFAASAYSHLVMVRKWNRQYLIFGSVQPTSNFVGNAPLEEETEITIEGKKVRFCIRRQGSMYILDMRGKSPLIRQLDGWHQYEHPYYWSNEIQQEAENAVKTVSTALETQKEGAENDFTSFTTFVTAVKGSSLSFNTYEKRNGNYSCTLRVKAGPTNTELEIASGGNKVRKRIVGKEWVEISLSEAELKLLNIKPANQVTITVLQGIAAIDWIKL